MVVILEALLRRIRVGETSAVGVLFFALWALLLGAMSPAAAAIGTVPSGPGISGLVTGGSASDTTYIARMDTLVVRGSRTLAARGGSPTGTDPRTADTMDVRTSDGSRRTSTVPTSADGNSRGPNVGADDPTPDGIAVGGLVADETFSVVGARFSRAFHDLWSPPEAVANANYTLRIHENPVPRFGAQVLVDIEDTTIYQGYLRPNRRQIEQAARTAVKRATLYLRKYYEPREVY